MDFRKNFVCFQEFEQSPRVRWQDDVRPTRFNADHDRDHTANYGVESLPRRIAKTVTRACSKIITFCCVRSRADGDHTGIHAVPATHSAASMTAVFSSYFTDSPAANIPNWG